MPYLRGMVALIIFMQSCLPQRAACPRKIDKGQRGCPFPQVIQGADLVIIDGLPNYEVDNTEKRSLKK